MKKYLITLLIFSCAISLHFVYSGGSQEGKTESKSTVVYWSMWNDQEPQAEVIKEWITDYKKIKPEVTVEVNFVGREVMTKLMTAISGGEVVDLVDTESLSVGGSLIMSGQAFTLDAALDKPSYEGDSTWRDSFIPGTIDQYAADDGSVFIINYSIITNGFIYDKKMWRDNGWTVPRTWDKFLALCSKIKTTSNIAPITQDGGLDFFNIMWNYQMMERLKGPGALFAAVGDKTGKSWEDPAFKKGIELERELFDKGYFIDGATGFTWPNGQLMLATREAAMELCGSWLPNELKDQVEDDWVWGSFPFPEISGGVGKLNDMESYLIGWVVMENTEVGVEIINFLKYCTNIENSQRYVDHTLNISANKKTTSPPELDELGTVYQNANVLFSPFDNISADYPDYFKNIYLKNHNLAFIGKITPDQYIELMKKDTIKYWKSK